VLLKFRPTALGNVGHRNAVYLGSLLVSLVVVFACIVVGTSLSGSWTHGLHGGHVESAPALNHQITRVESGFTAVFEHRGAFRVHELRGVPLAAYDLFAIDAQGVVAFDDLGPDPTDETIIKWLRNSAS
jgi:hypothetical protein